MGRAAGGQVSDAVEWVAVDWGTSNLRAWGIDSAGGTVFARSSPEGMGRLTREDYPGVLGGLLSGLVERPTDVLVCGMAGARQGWMEAPYVEVPAALSALGRFAVTPQMHSSQFSVRILPGLCQRSIGAEDVMRGEETQLLGLTVLRPGYSGPVLMPGTHCKWVTVDAGRIERFESAMTGEIFDVMGHHSVLRHSLVGETSGPASEDGLMAGLEAGLEDPGRLTSLLFKTRAAALLSARGPDWCSGYLSGVLVGAEVGGHRSWFGTGVVPLIGSDRLNHLYAAALRMAGAAGEAMDATAATLAGLAEARRQGVAA
jgi:2-dehydro-3-deoxygalactonokinase